MLYRRGVALSRQARYTFRQKSLLLKNAGKGVFMHKAAFARPGAWLCLLGSALALTGFFLPYFGTQPVSLWESILLFLRPEYIDAQAIGAIFLGLQLLALITSFLACLVVFLLPRQWNILPLYLMLTSFALGCYLLIVCSSLFLLWVDAQIASEPLTVDNLGLALGSVHIGAWLIPLGLVLALIGCKRQEARVMG